MSDLTYQDVLNILRLIDSGQFEKFEIEYEGTKIKVARRAGSPAPGDAPRSAAPSLPASSSGAMQHGETAKPAAAPDHGAGKTASAAPASKRGSSAPAGGVEIKAPMAGTFYAAPSPGAAPFVEVGRSVRKGDQLGIVEVMKLFTAIAAPCDGVVRSILVANEEFVQNEQTLMTIEAAR